MNTPLVSVIIPAFRCAETLSDAICSALRQDVPLEILVIDDCSPDHLSEVMAQWQDLPNVIYLRNEQNLGAAQSRNLGVHRARGTYVAFLDADDIWREGKLKKQLAALERTGSVLCATARELMDPEGTPSGHVLPVDECITYRDLLRHNSIACSSVLLRTDVARRFPMEHEDSHEDYILWLRILQEYESACGINEPLLLYRLTVTGKSGGKLKSAKMTFRAYRYMGFGLVKSCFCFCSYALHGVYKYFLKR
ncbi:MAG: glycosyltransferase family 2 protein [Oscillospiraceae bacterium]|nr:glycosyltransferase family 2 protein [Oscillospiraceae bacterium]